MRADLRKKLMAKLDATYLRVAGLATHGKEFGENDEKWKKLAKTTFSAFRKKYELALRALPDQHFDVENARLDSQPAEIRKTLTGNIRTFPKRRGGRPPDFPAEIRTQAIDDVAHELRTNS